MLKKYILLSLVYLSSYCCTAQSLNFPYAPDVIVFDLLSGRTDKVIPFDKPFAIRVENFPAGKIKKIEVYQTHYFQGGRDLVVDKGTLSIPDIIVKKRDYTKDKDKLTVFLPALKPNRDFDILVSLEISTDNFKLMEELNHVMYNAGGIPDITSVAVKTAFTSFIDGVNPQPFETKRFDFPTASASIYCDSVFTPLVKADPKIFKPAGFKQCLQLSDEDIQSFAGSICSDCVQPVQLNMLENVLLQNKYAQIVNGILKIAPLEGQEEAADYQLSKRKENLGYSIAYFDTLLMAINDLSARQPELYAGVRKKISDINTCLRENLKIIDELIKEVIDFLNHGEFYQSIWLAGNTQSKDLVTKGSSIFVLDAGMALLGARDVNNDILKIPKLYWGVNIFFRPVDKNVKLKYLPAWKAKHSTDEDANIVAVQNIFQRMCLTVGFTLGSFRETNFENLYSGSTLLVGPSWRFGRALRVSAGLSVFRRLGANPTITDKKVATGTYFSTSLDFDLLQNIKTVTGLLFK